MPSNEALMETVVAQETRLERLKKKSAEMAERTGALVFTVGGGLAAGYLDSEFREQVNGVWKSKEIFGVPYSTLAGAGVTVIGLMGWAGQYSKPCEHFGSGMLACEAYKILRNKLAEGRADPGDRGQVGATMDALNQAWQGR